MILVKRLNVVKKIDEKDLEAHVRLGFTPINGAVTKAAEPEVPAKEAPAEKAATVVEAAEAEVPTAEDTTTDTTEDTTTKKGKKK